jgi:hypothetical protein
MEPTTNAAAKLFEQILAQARTDPNIVGFFLGGSRGKGMVTEHSDYDCVMVVTEEVLPEYARRYGHPADPRIEAEVVTLEKFRNHAAWGSSTAWDRYNFAHVTPLVDKTGELAGMLREKGSVPEAERRKFVAGHLDGYINQVYRSLKCFRDGQAAGARLEAADSVRPMLDVVFGMHGRVRPYYKYLEWELRAFPLEKLTMAPEELTEALLKILETGSVRAQRLVLEHVEGMARADGYGAVVDDWGWRLGWMKEFSHKE